MPVEDAIASSRTPAQGVAGLVSVIMPAFRMGRYIGDALNSVAAQSYQNWEVIVVDDLGPEDGTHDVVRAFADGHPSSRVELIRHTVNQGVSAARNTAFAASNGEYIAFLDPDDSWLPDHLQQLIGLLSDGGVSVATGPVEVFWDGAGPTPTRTSSVQGWRQRSFPHALSLYNFIQPSATLVRRSALTNVGGFDTDPGIQHIEDYDLWIRLIEAGERFGFLAKHTSRYRKHEGGATNDMAKSNALADRLYAKHTSYFRPARSMMIMTLLQDAHRMEQELAVLRNAQNGPLMRSIQFADRLLKRLTKATGDGLDRNPKR